MVEGGAIIQAIAIRTGLNAAEVDQRVADGLVNVQIDKNKTTVGKIIRNNVFTFFNFLNLILAGLLIYVGSYGDLTFLPVILANTGIGIFQELRAKRTLDKLSLLSASKARVIRNGQEQKLEIEKLVLDDIMVLSSGNQRAADAVVREGSLEVNESLLTGESDTVFKVSGDALYSGSFVVSGKAFVQVTHVGEENYANKISAQARAVKKHPSELRDAMNQILKIVSILIVPMGVGFFLSQYYITGLSLNDAIVKTGAAVIGMIPEGLVLLTSVALAVGVMNLARRKTLVQELFCIETLARVDMLCLDKTGTLTEGRMQVQQVCPLKKDLPLDKIMGNILRVLPDDNVTFQTLKAHFGMCGGFTEEGVIPFSSDRKYSGAYFAGQGTYIMGAFEFMFPPQDYAEIGGVIESYTRQGFRVLTLAHSRNFPKEREIPEGLFPCALILISDIIRADARKTLEYFAEQGVELMVISGDHPATAAYAAAQAGLRGAERFVDASTLTTEEAIAEAVKYYRVFGRVTPMQKKEIIMALKAQGHTVAMTGDGVNDVPALKEADCSIAMAQGSDAAKSSSNLVLLNSEFSSLTYVVKEGRRVINNIQSAASLFLVKTIFSVILPVIMICFSINYPFDPRHLTLISTCAVGIPTFLISMEPNFARVRAGFLRHVIHNALTGALTVIFNICVITAVTAFYGYPEPTRVTLCMISTGLTSLYMIRQVYPPTTFLRKAVSTLMFALFLGSMLFMKGFLDLADLRYELVIVLMIIVMAVPHMIEVFYSLLTNTKKLGSWIKQKVRNKFTGKDDIDFESPE